MNFLCAVEDIDNLGRLFSHYFGPDWDRSLGNRDLMDDLLRYCARLRNQPNTRAHQTEGWNVPEHQLIGKPHG